MKKLPILVTIDGMDGAGKETLVNEVEKEFISRGKKVKRFNFPDYDSMDGELIRAIQMGTYGGGKDECQKILDDSLLGALPYTINRMMYYKRNGITWEGLKEEYDVILFDRNYTSNWLYYAHRIIPPLVPGTMTEKQAASLLEWIRTMYTMEIEHTWLQDAVKEDALFVNFFLHGNPHFLRERMKKREEKRLGNTIQTELDLNESQELLMSRIRSFGQLPMNEIFDAIYFRLEESRDLVQNWIKVCTLNSIRVHSGPPLTGIWEDPVSIPTNFLLKVMMEIIIKKLIQDRRWNWGITNPNLMIEEDEDE